MNTVILGVATAAVVLSCGAANANLLVNGDFEGGVNEVGLPNGWTYSAQVSSGPYNTANVGVVKGSAFVPCCGVTGTGPQLANHVVTFGGGDSDNAGGYLGQRFATKIGSPYKVTFDLGAIGNSNSQTMGVAIDDGVSKGWLFAQAYKVYGDNDLGSTLHRLSFSFIAPTAHSIIYFSNYLSSTQSIDAIIDNVNIAAAAPEPAGWVMMLGGFALAGASLRRRLSQQQF